MFLGKEILRKQLRCSWELCQHLPHSLGSSPTWREHTSLCHFTSVQSADQEGKWTKNLLWALCPKLCSGAAKSPRCDFCAAGFSPAAAGGGGWASTGWQAAASLTVPGNEDLQQPAEASCNTSLVNSCQGCRLQLFCCHCRWRSQSLGEALGRGASSETCTALTTETGNIPSAFQYLFLFNLPALLTSLRWRGN